MPGPVVVPRPPRKAKRMAPHHAGIAVFLALTFGTAVAFMVFFELSKPTAEELRQRAVAEAEASKRARDDGKQKDRLSAIRKMSSEGIIVQHGFGSDGRATVVLYQPFFVAPAKDQNAVLGVVWWYYHVESGSRKPMNVRLDNGSVMGKPMGTYEPLEGFSR